MRPPSWSARRPCLPAATKRPSPLISFNKGLLSPATSPNTPAKPPETNVPLKCSIFPQTLRCDIQRPPLCGGLQKIRQFAESATPPATAKFRKKKRSPKGFALHELILGTGQRRRAPQRTRLSRAALCRRIRPETRLPPVFASNFPGGNPAGRPDGGDYRGRPGNRLKESPREKRGFKGDKRRAPLPFCGGSPRRAGGGGRRRFRGLRTLKPGGIRPEAESGRRASCRTSIPPGPTTASSG